MFTGWILGCRSFREVLECTIRLQGVALAPVRPVCGGTHDSEGIFPVAPILCLTESFLAGDRG